MAIHGQLFQEPTEADTSYGTEFLSKDLLDDLLDSEPDNYLFRDEIDDDWSTAIDSVGKHLPDPDPANEPGCSSYFTSLWNLSSSAYEPSRTFQTSEPYAVGSGIRNIGNACYMNSVLQCFTHTVPLMEGLQSLKHHSPCDRCLKGFCVICSLREHVHRSLSIPRIAVSPSPFMENLDFFSSSFRKFEQEDAHEFLQSFLDRLESCTSADENLVKKVFGGSLISKLECSNCGYLSVTPEALVDLSLEMEDVDSLTEALGSFTKMEKIEDLNSECQNCKEKVDMAKQLLVDEAPSVAVLHLKRFKAHESYTEKIEKHIEIPLELDLKPYMVEASDDDNVGSKYDLYGVVVHSGLTLAFGHYYSFIKSSSDTWHQLNDEMVTPVSEEAVLSENAYILFYARRGTPWFSEFMKDEKVVAEPEGRTNNVSPKSVLETCEASSSANPLVSVSHEADDLMEKVLSISVNSCIVSPLGETNQPREKAEEEYIPDDIFHPLTPSRPQTPETFNSFETPGSSHQIPRDHLKSEEKPVSRKRFWNKSADDAQKKEAVRYLTRSVPSSRGNKLMEAIFGPQSEVSVANKKRRLGSPCKRVSPANDRNKSNHPSLRRPVAAILR